ncbi:MAG: pyridoxamine 5'-phosphate oxidase family protein [Candidatus Levybacteria bacterium]|nr:pyridoxamine 5'-phosphate oxidase family protein [Candidatus Levybacteria bacterium]
MTFEDCRKFANENPSCFLATIDGDQPRVRGMQLLFCNEKGFYFTTGSMKNMCEQLKKNPKTEVCFFSSKEFKSMRVEGEVEFITDMKEKENIFGKVSWLKSIVGTPDNTMWTPFRISKGRAYFWTMQTNLEGPIFIEFDLR